MFSPRVISSKQFVRKFLPVSVFNPTRKQSTHTTSTITHKNTVLLKNTDCACENLKADSFVHVFPLKRWWNQKYHATCLSEEFILILQLYFQVDGGWSNWQTQSKCSVTCGGGVRSSIRYCDHPAPAHGGSSCPGSATRKEPCNPTPCPGNNT